MKKLLCITVVFLLLSSICLAEEVITTKDGKKVLLKDDNTWEYLNDSNLQPTPPQPNPQSKPTVAKYAEEAIEVWNTTLSHTTVDYSDAVAFYIHYKNNTAKKVIGVSVYVAIYNPFGKVAFDKTFDDEVALEPLERLKNDTYWVFKNNPFIGDEPYDRLWQMAKNGTAKVQTKVLKVIFEDGTVLSAKPAPKKK